MFFQFQANFLNLHLLPLPPVLWRGGGRGESRGSSLANLTRFLNPSLAVSTYRLIIISSSTDIIPFTPRGSPWMSEIVWH